MTPLRSATNCLTLIVIPLLALLVCCRQDTETGSPGRITLTLGAYTTPREAYGKAIIPAFQQFWKQKTGQDVEFQTSYQGSGAQSRAIISGFEADVAALSLAEDVEKIVEAGLITHDWKSGANRGIVSTSVVVVAVRSGNPLKIRDWTDLTRSGVEILSPDPRTSGGAMWNICAVYGAALRGKTGAQKDDRQAAAGFLEAVLRNVSVMDKGARESITNFEKGIGDVAVTYENEVLVGRKSGQRYDYVIPPSTILIENPAAVIDKYADKHGVQDAAKAFVDFLSSAEAQKAFAEHGLRPVHHEVAAELASRFPPVEDLWTIEYLGGWKQVMREIFSQNGVYSSVINRLHSSR